MRHTPPRRRIIMALMGVHSFEILTGGSARYSLFRAAGATKEGIPRGVLLAVRLVLLPWLRRTKCSPLTSHG